MNIDFYRKYLNISTAAELCDKLCDTVIETNRTYDFFVDWEKVIRNQAVFKYELSLLAALRNSANPAQDMKALISRYPEVIKVLPILVAYREGLIKVLDTMKPEIIYKDYDLTKSLYTDLEKDEIVDFTAKTGLLEQLCKMESANDYLLGIEVGLDTNARKNRSGLFLEKIVSEIIEELVTREPSIKCIQQKTFGYVENCLGIPIPTTLRDRKFDYAIIKDGKATTIEVNFYGGTGSKPSEIVSSYTNRSEVLQSAGWKFVWLTDGCGWRKMTRPLRVGVEGIQYVINTDMLRSGILEKIINN